jgi:hypothetical protein
MTEEPSGTVFCPKCGFKFALHKSRPMKCQICSKDVYGEYPRIKLTLFKELYGDESKPESYGFICKKCAVKLGLLTVESKVPTETKKT